MPTTLKLSEIKVKDQPRKDFSRVDEIAASIEKVGLLQPVAVRISGSGEYFLVDGEQRLRAFKKLGKTEIPIFLIGSIDGADELSFKEQQLMANLMRSDLTLIERMRGFSELLVNAPAKYNELVIANKFGLKEKEVKKMVALAKALDPAVDAALASGHYDDEEMDRLASIPKQFQASVIAAADRSGHNIDNGIRATSDELIFDSVFTLEQARSAGKLHVQDPWTNVWRTFDKPFAHKARKEYEDRTKKSHQQELAKEKSKTSKEKELTAEQKKKNFEKEKVEREKNLQDLKSAVNTALTAESNPKKKEICRILQDNLRKLQSEQLRTILRAYGVEFKATNSSTDDMRKMACKHVFGDDMTAIELVNAITLIDCASYGINAKEWAKAIRKKL